MFFQRAALALAIVAAPATAQTTFVCGVDYSDASKNCTVNPPCPSGEGCPLEKGICFAMPRDQCFTPVPTTSAPTGNPTLPQPSASPTKAPLFVCGEDYNDAFANCKGATMCPGGAMSLCPNGSSCFTIPWIMCEESNMTPVTPVTSPPTPLPTPEPTPLATAEPTTPMPTPEPTPEPTPGPTISPNVLPTTNQPTADPTPAPTTTPKVCGTDSFAAQANCPDPSKHCPTGDGCPAGEACFIVPNSLCGVTGMPTPLPTAKPTMMAVINDVGQEMPGGGELTPSPTSMFFKVCGMDYGDASGNCRGNPPCPSGDGCPAGLTCYALPLSVCPRPPEPSVGPTHNPSFSPVNVPIITAQPTTSAVNALTTTTAQPTMSLVNTITTAPPTEVKVIADQLPPSLIEVCGSDYNNAVENICSNQLCPSGGGCAGLEVCYALPYVDCSIPQLVTSSPTVTPGSMTAPLTDVNPAITLSPTLIPSIIPTLPNPTESPIYNKFFCGESYMEAEENCLTAEPCPLGSGCSSGACFGISTERCMSAAPTDRPTGPGPQPTDSPTISSAPTPVVTVSHSPTTSVPTKSPVYNTYFCGESYMEAEENCLTAEPCPLGSGCSSGACFGISTERCMSAAPTDRPTGPGPQPTDSPTVSSPPTESPTISKSPQFHPTANPTESPVVNTFFCGSDYMEAEGNCSEVTACPTGACPFGQTCYAGISCVSAGMATDTEPKDSAMSILGISDSGDAPTPASETTNNEPTSLGQLTLGKPTPADQPAGISDGITATPTTLWQGMFGGPSPKDPTPSPVTHERYCGNSLTDAMSRCATTIACPDGFSDGCLPGQTCFPIPEPCDSFMVIGGGSGGASEVSTQSDSTTPAPQPHVFNPSHTSFCGRGYADALDNCHLNVPCPGGSMEECPLGQMCYTGISGCEPPFDPSSNNENNFEADTGTILTLSPTPFIFDSSQTSFCGVDYLDAVENCYRAQPCPSGPTCPDGQTCFPGIMNCEMPSAETLAGIENTAGEEFIFDPSETSFCGMDYFDAVENCYKAQPCTAGQRCPEGQVCIPGIMNCEMPPAGTVATGEASDTTLEPVPSSNGTPQPTWPDFSARTRDADAMSSSSMALFGAIMKTVVAGGLIVGVLLF